AIVEHHMRLFGLRHGTPLVLAPASECDFGAAREACAKGETVVALDPDAGFCHALGASDCGALVPTGHMLVCPAATERSWRRLRTLHAVRGFMHPNGVPVVATQAALPAAWLWVPHGRSGVLLVGTELAADLIRYRQGDPSRA